MYLLEPAKKNVSNGSVLCLWKDQLSCGEVLKGFTPTLRNELFYPAQVVDSWHPAGASHEEYRKSIPLFHLSSFFTNPCINKSDNRLRP